MKRWLVLLGVLGSTVAALAQVRPPEPEMTLRDLEGKNPKRLSADELKQLIPGAKMSRIAVSGSMHQWSNDSGGSFVISSDNMGTGTPVRAQGRPSQQVGKWHLSDDGRYCVMIEWKAVPTEEWCRYIVQAGDQYYTAKSDTVGTERVNRIEIKK